MVQMARYINRQVLLTFFTVITVLLLVAVGGRFTGYLQEALMGKYSPDALLSIIMYRFPEFIQQLIPFSFFISTVFVFTRMRSDNELTVIRTTGAGVSKLLLWICPTIFMMTIMVSILSLEVTPANIAKLDNLFMEQRDREEFDGVSAGVFRTLPRSGRVTYTESVSENRQILSGVFIAEQGPEKQITIWADKGRRYADDVTGSQFLVLENGSRYEGFAGLGNYRIMEFGLLTQRIDVARAAPKHVNPEAVPSDQLFLRGDALSRAELEWRVSLPFLMLIGSIIAVAISHIGPKYDNFLPMASGVAIFVGYYLFLIIIKDLLEEGKFAFFWANFLVHATFFIVSLYLLYKSETPRRGQ